MSNLTDNLINDLIRNYKEEEKMLRQQLNEKLESKFSIRESLDPEDIKELLIQQNNLKTLYLDNKIDLNVLISKIGDLFLQFGYKLGYEESIFITEIENNIFLLKIAQEKLLQIDKMV